MEDFVIPNTIYKTIVGSTAYGLNTTESDIDTKGICIKPKEMYFGLRNFEQQEFGADAVIYCLQKFVKMARDCNPNVVEMLYVEPRFILNINKFGKRLRENRELFLSSKARYSFGGYAFSQLKRIKGHRRWITFDQTPPNEEEFFKVKYRTVNGKSVKYTKFMEHDYDSAKKKYAQYLDWKEKRNPKRAVLEDKFGYDTKHAMHLMRLLRMGVEILEKGEVNVFREDRNELLDIRNGVWSYDKLVEKAEELAKRLDGLYDKTNLPNKPNDKEINKLLISITEEFLDEQK